MSSVHIRLTTVFACMMVATIMIVSVLSFAAAKSTRVVFIGDTPRTMAAFIGDTPRTMTLGNSH